SSSAVFPSPGDPVSSSKAPRPPRTRSSASVMSRHSPVRPTSTLIRLARPVFPRIRRPPERPHSGACQLALEADVMNPSLQPAPPVTDAGATRPGRSVAEHVIFGAGAVGLAIADSLLARGVAPGNVRVVNRSGYASLPAGVQVLGGDASDPDFSAHA